jgi:hydrogenase/urease accessory protein HupE
MEMIVGYTLIILGIVLEIISVLVWLGVLKPASNGAILQSVTFWDILLELTKRAPWPAVVGLLNIYAGLKLVGVELPF